MGTEVVQDFDQDHNDLDKCLVAVSDRWSAAGTETGAETRRGRETAVMAVGKEEEEEEQAELSVGRVQEVKGVIRVDERGKGEGSGLLDDAYCLL
jgi:hypothetical protein